MVYFSFFGRNSSVLSIIIPYDGALKHKSSNIPFEIFEYRDRLMCYANRNVYAHFYSFHTYLIKWKIRKEIHFRTLKRGENFFDYLHT